MRFLFVGSGEELARAMIAGEGDASSSFCFIGALPAASEAEGFDAVVTPALGFLRWDLSGAPRPRLPVLASGPPGSLAECLDAGCADYLREPWSLGELEARLARVACGDRDEAPAASAPDGDGGFLGLAAIFDEASGRPLGKAYLAGRLGIEAGGGRAVDMRVARLRAALRAAGRFAEAASLRCERGAYRYPRDCGKLVTCLCRKS